MKKNNKKPLIALAGLALIVLVGGAFAYFTSEASIANLFQSATYSTTVEETFTSPTDWKPGDVTTKKVEVTNTGDVEVAVRAKIEQKWTSANNGNLGLKQEENEAAIIHFANTNKWVANDDGWYYYTDTLAKGAKSASFLESVEFNPLITNDITCTGDGTVVCTSTGNGYDNATYELKVTIQTVQADAKDTVWGTN